MKKILLILTISLFLILNSVSADYTRNINDEVKLLNVEEKLHDKIDKYENKELIKKSILRAIEKKLGKTQEEIMEIDVFSKEQKSFIEYAFVFLYRSTQYGPQKDKDQTIKIVENNFVKAITYEGDNNEIIVLGDSIYSKSIISDSYSLLAKFWELPKNKDIIDYINENIIDPDFSGKCRAYLREDYNGISDGIPRNDSFGIKAYGEYAEQDYSNYVPVKYCGNYGDTNGVTYFKMISDNILMFASPGQEAAPGEFETVEVLDSITKEENNRISIGNGVSWEKQGESSFLLYKGRLIDDGKNIRYLKYNIDTPDYIEVFVAEDSNTHHLYNIFIDSTHNFHTYVGKEGTSLYNIDKGQSGLYGMEKKWK